MDLKFDKMYEAVGHIARRALPHLQPLFETQSLENANQGSMPWWGLVVIVITVMGWSTVAGAIRYTYSDVIATLAIVESPAALYAPVKSDGPDAVLGEKIDANVVQPELILLKQIPITSKLRSAMKHLRAKAGFWSRFRGLSLWIILAFTTGRIADVFAFVPYIPGGVNYIMASVVTSHLYMAWTHIVISEPSSKYWFRRLPNIKLWSKVAIPTAVAGIADHLSGRLPMHLAQAYRLDQLAESDFANMKACAIKVLVFKVMSVLALGLILKVLIVIPASVTLIRVQASLLSEEEETIVPFDRTFDGKVVPEIVDGSGVIGMLDAWKTFDWNSRVRLLKLYAKVGAMEAAVYVVLVGVLIGEARLIASYSMPQPMNTLDAPQ